MIEPIEIEKYEKIVLPRKETWGFLTSADSFLAHTEEITPEDIKGVSLLISKRPEVQQMFSQWSKTSVEELPIVGTYNLIFNVFSLVENHVGSALTVSGAVGQRRNEAIKFLPLVPQIETSCVLVWKKNRVLSPVVIEFIRRFRDSFQ